MHLKTHVASKAKNYGRCKTSVFVPSWTSSKPLHMWFCLTTEQFNMFLTLNSHMRVVRTESNITVQRGSSHTPDQSAALRWRRASLPVCERSRGNPRDRCLHRTVKVKTTTNTTTKTVSSISGISQVGCEWKDTKEVEGSSHIHDGVSRLRLFSRGKLDDFLRGL